MEQIGQFTPDNVFTVFNAVRISAFGILSFFIALILTPLWIRILKKFKLGKQLRTEGAPIFQSMHKNKEGTPTMGGVLIWGTAVILIIGTALLADLFGGRFEDFNFLSRSQTYLPLGALIVAGLVGVLDDLMGIYRVGSKGGGLSMLHRIILYTAVAVGGAWWFYTKLEFSNINIPFFGDVDFGLLYIPFVVLILVASAFSANETDGLDGLAAGVFLTMFGAYGAIAFVQGRMDLVVLIATLMGSMVAFLWYNIFPAKFFMGDTGSMSLGITLGIVAMYTNTPFLLIPIAIIFIIESASVIIQVISKKLRGKKIFLSAPIHHHFEAKGWPETQVTMRFWMISAIGSLIGLIIFLIDSKIPPLW